MGTALVHVKFPDGKILFTGYQTTASILGRKLFENENDIEMKFIPEEWYKSDKTLIKPTPSKLENLIINDEVIDDIELVEICCWNHQKTWTGLASRKLGYILFDFAYWFEYEFKGCEYLNEQESSEIDRIMSVHYEEDELPQWYYMLDTE